MDQGFEYTPLVRLDKDSSGSCTSADDRPETMNTPRRCLDVVRTPRRPPRGAPRPRQELAAEPVL